MKQIAWKESALRNFRFWGGMAEKTVGFVIGFSLLYGFLFTTGMGGSTLESALRTIPMYAIGMGAMMMLIMQMSYSVAYVPVVLSFGSRRGETFWGIQFMNLVTVLQVVAFVVLFQILDKGFASVSVSTIVIALSALILGSGIGQFCTAGVLKLGHAKGVILFVVIILMVCGMLVGGVMFVNTSGQSSYLAARLQMMTTGEILTLTSKAAAIAGAGIYGISMLFLSLAFRRYEVRR